MWKLWFFMGQLMKDFGLPPLCGYSLGQYIHPEKLLKILQLYLKLYSSPPSTDVVKLFLLKLLQPLKEQFKFKEGTQLELSLWQILFSMSFHPLKFKIYGLYLYFRKFKLLLYVVLWRPKYLMNLPCVTTKNKLLDVVAKIKIVTHIFTGDLKLE